MSSNRTTGKVLVLGDDTMSFLAIVRSLGRRGITVDAAADDPGSPALASRYIRHHPHLPSYSGSGQEWEAAMIALLTAELYDLVLPCNERSLLPIDHHRERLAPLARLAVPDRAAMHALFDKNATRELAARLNIPVAPGCLFREDDDAAKLIATLGAPLVLKTRQSYALDDLENRGGAVVIRDLEALQALIRTKPDGEWLAEAFCEGPGIGMAVLASRGKLLQTFEYRYVRDLQGACFYRISAAPTPRLRAHCAAFVAALGYTGLAMFEFKGDVLLEVNARPWAGLPLSTALGIDFPFRLYQLLVKGEETPELDYRPGVYGRNLTPDTSQIVASARALSGQPLAFARFIGARIAEFGRMLIGREHNDTLVWDDPCPGLIEIGRMLAATARRLVPPI
jgi:predicted ATP-grasp superfamily ATP-dependent carboligase